MRIDDSDYEAWEEMVVANPEARRSFWRHTQNQSVWLREQREEIDSLKVENKRLTIVLDDIEARVEETLEELRGGPMRWLTDILRVLFGWHSIYDGSTCRLSEGRRDVHDYHVSKGGDGRPEHFRSYKCTKCGKRFQI